MHGLAVMLSQNQMLDPDASTVAPIHLHACRFFCGPNAKKSAALAKQQKKRPRGDGKQKGKKAVADSDSEDDSDAASDSGIVFACSSASGMLLSPSQSFPHADTTAAGKMTPHCCSHNSKHSRSACTAYLGLLENVSGGLCASSAKKRAL